MRPRQPDAGTGALGAILGGLAGGLPGVLIGGLAGAVAGGEIPSLEDALSAALNARGMQLVRLVRDSKFSITFLFEARPDSFWTLRGAISPDPSLTPVALDDALYDRAVAELDLWRVHHGPSAHGA